MYGSFIAAFSLKVTFHCCTCVLSLDKSHASDTHWCLGAGLFDAPGPAIGASGSALQNPKEVFTLSSLLCKAGAPEVLTQCDETAVKTIIKKNKFPPSFFKCFSFYHSLLSSRSRVHGWRLFICSGWGSCWGAETLFVLFSYRRTLLYFLFLLEMSSRMAMLSAYK